VHHAYEGEKGGEGESATQPRGVDPPKKKSRFMTAPRRPDVPPNASPRFEVNPGSQHTQMLTENSASLLSPTRRTQPW